MSPLSSPAASRCSTTTSSITGSPTPSRSHSRTESPRVAAPAVGASSTGNVRPARPAGRLGSEEFHSASLPTAQEAAILYAANQVEAAAYLLKVEIKDPVGRNNKQAWLMLFDLYQERGGVEFLGA